MVACPLSSANLSGHIQRRQQKKNESGWHCAYLLPGLYFETRHLADGLPSACYTMLKPAPSIAFNPRL